MTSPSPLRFDANGIAVAPDGRTVYFGGTRSESDIWIADRRQ